ncbi:hypothetical protein BGX38DRAFT_1245165, partial [Terfezia claveryi]
MFTTRLISYTLQGILGLFLVFRFFSSQQAPTPQASIAPCIQHDQRLLLNEDKLIDLHERYGHISGKMTEPIICEACQLGQTTKPAARAGQGIRTSKPLERLPNWAYSPETPSSQF